MHPIKLLITSSFWFTPILSLPYPQDDPPATDLLGRHPQQEQQHRNREHDLTVGLTGGVAITTLISAVRERRFRAETKRNMQRFKRKYVELRNRMPLDQPEILETYWDGKDEFFADKKLVECMKNNLSIEDDWDPPMYISPDRWNAVGPSCPGWKSKYSAPPGAFRNIIPPKRPNGEGQKESAEEDRPQQFPLELIPARIIDAANRLASVGTKAAAAKKGPSLLPKVQGAPSFAPIPVL